MEHGGDPGAVGFGGHDAQHRWLVLAALTTDKGLVILSSFLPFDFTLQGYDRIRQFPAEDVVTNPLFDELRLCLFLPRTGEVVDRLTLI